MSHALARIVTKSKLVSRFFASQSCKMSSYSDYETISVNEASEFVYHVQLSRPDKLNAMNDKMWEEIGDCFSLLANDSSCRSIVLSGKGRVFTAGIDLAHLMEMSNVVSNEEDIARKARKLKILIEKYQNSFSTLEKCPKPVIAAVHNACIGGGIDLITAADVRYCAKDAFFSVKEVDVGLAADVGTLQRLPKVIGSQSFVRELAFTGRNFYADEALLHGFVSRTFSDQKTLLEGAMELAKIIAEKSPVAVQATKQAIIHARDHSVQDGLDFIANMNMCLLQSDDTRLAAMAAIQKQKANFSKL